MSGLLDPMVPEEKRHASFEVLRTRPAYESARWMVENIFANFGDPDGNFVEQFQSTAFDARFFELFLFAYFHRSGFEVDRTHNAPDFLISDGETQVAVEATTVNPSTSGVLAEYGKSIGDLTQEEIREYQRHELPIRFGGPLYSKLGKRYWELPHCAGRPFVLAIQAFHDDDSLTFGDSALSGYLYGSADQSGRDPAGKLQISFEQIYDHVVGEKRVPSAFFGQEETEHISAVVFSNTGTVSTFARIGYQMGVANDRLKIQRLGHALDELADASEPAFFFYDMDNPPGPEPWGQGLVVCHNPHAQYPIPEHYFPHAAEYVLTEEGLSSFTNEWHPFGSKTILRSLAELKPRMMELQLHSTPQVAIISLTKDEFQGVTGHPGPSPPINETGWVRDDTGSFLGVTLQNTESGDHGGVVMARDEFFRFRAIDQFRGLSSHLDARRQVDDRILKLLLRPQRIFAQE